jgi:hypothetical protein
MNDRKGSYITTPSSGSPFCILRVIRRWFGPARQVLSTIEMCESALCKIAPLYALKAHKGSGVIAPHILKPRHKSKVSAQLYAPAALACTRLCGVSKIAG